MEYTYYRLSDDTVMALKSDGSQDSYKPKGARKMTDAQVQAHLNPKPEKTAIVALLNSDFEAAMKAIHAGWPDYEVQTWTVQNDEARQWTAAPEADKPATPLLTSIYESRSALGWQGTFKELVDSVIRNSDAYTAAVGKAVAVRHVAERDIAAASDPSTVKWSF